MKRPVLFAATTLLLLGGLVLGGCGNGAETPPPSTTPGTESGTENPTAASVEIREFAFSPVDAEIGVGETVEWTNGDAVAHTVTGDGFDSGLLSQGQTFRKLFDKAGTYEYTCSVHPAMKGSVTVK